MSGRTALLLLGLAAAAAAIVAVRPGAAPSLAPRPVAGGHAERAPRGSARAPALDPATIRDVFRFADEAVAAVGPEASPPAPAAAEPASAPAGPRLVGLVRRQGALLAAFAIGGDVVLAGAGQQAGGLTVLEVGEDGVRVRLPDGREERLALP